MRPVTLPLRPVLLAAFGFLATACGPDGVYYCDDPAIAGPYCREIDPNRLSDPSFACGKLDGQPFDTIFGPYPTLAAFEEANGL